MSEILGRLRRCTACGAYTMLITHHKMLSTNAHSPVFKPFDRYAKYREMEKEIE
jgi:rRNA maturation protein Nop10